MRENFTENLKVGDEVVYHCWGGFRTSSFYIEKVESITKSGLIKVCGNLFYKDGRVRGDYACSILPKNEESIELVEKSQKEIIIQNAKNRLRSDSLSNMTYEQAIEIMKIMGWDNKTEEN